MSTPPRRPSLAIRLAMTSLSLKAQGPADFTPAYLKLRLAGNASSEIEITGAVPRSLAPLGAIALDASSGAVLRTQLPGARDANHATLATLYTSHFGEFGNAAVQWLYFLLGLGGAFLFSRFVAPKSACRITVPRPCAAKRCRIGKKARKT
jgi:hypothetical protein